MPELYTADLFVLIKMTVCLCDIGI